MLIGDILTHNAHFYPGRLALAQDGVRLSFAEVEGRVNALANGLLKLGLQKGDRLAILSGNCYQYPEFYFAVAKTGIVGVPLNVRLAIPEMVAFLKYVKPLGLVVSAEFARHGEALQAEVPGLEIVVGLGKGHNFSHDYDELIARNAATPPAVPLTEDDTYLLGATSGTTGIPKGAILTHRNAIHSMLMWYSEIRWPHFGPYLQVSPQFFNPGGPNSMAPFIKGGPVVVLPQFTPEAALRAIEKEKPVFTVCPTSILTMIINHPDVTKYDVSSLMGVVTGGSTPPVPVIRRATEVFGNILHPTYGMCETYSSGAQLRRADLVTDGDEKQMRRLKSCGHPMVGIELRVVNEEGRDVKHNSEEVGEIIMRGPSVCKGYWDKPEETAETFRDGWLHTGDLAMVDEDGYIYIVDRIKDMIKTGTINVYSVEVESCIAQHPAVLQVAVIGVPDARWGEAVKALVVLRPGHSATEQEIIEHCKARLASFKKPQSVEFRTELPLGGTGKTLKRQLREPYWAGYEKRVN